MNIWLLIAGAAIFMSLLMAGMWLLQRWLNDAGIVDVAWSYSVGVLAIFFCLTADGGYWPRQLLVAVLAGCWSVRLGTYLLTRVIRLPEDGRYVRLRKNWGDRVQFALFWFYQAQALAAVGFALPMLIAAKYNVQPLGLFDLAAVILFAGALSCEFIADWQLNAFRNDPTTKGKVCRRGFWRYSRHPNYFFEWLHWGTYPLLAIGAPYGWLTFLAPVVMLYFITRSTGIAVTEQHAVESRGEAYRQYQRTTSAFVPWPPRDKSNG